MVVNNQFAEVHALRARLAAVEEVVNGRYWGTYWGEVMIPRTQLLEALAVPAPELEPEQPKVLPRQVWADNDSRNEGRTLLVNAIENGKAVCTVLAPAFDNPIGRSGHKVRILLNRFKPTGTGYRMIQKEDGTVLETLG